MSDDSDDIGRQLRRFKGFTNRAPGDAWSPPRSSPLPEDKSSSDDTGSKTLEDTYDHAGSKGFIIFSVLFYSAPFIIGALVLLARKLSG